MAFRIHHTNRLLRTHLSRFLAEHADGLGPEQWFVLARLAERQPIRQVELAVPVLVDAPNVSRLIDGLVHRGLVDRSADPSDRRSWLVGLTDEGTDLVRRMRPRTLAERRRVFDGLSERQLTELVGTLDHVDANLLSLLNG